MKSFTPDVKKLDKISFHGIIQPMSFEPKNPDEIIQNLKNKIPFKSFSFVSVPVVVSVFIFLLAVKGSIYTIQPNEVGVLLRFGKFTQITNPGLHFKIPFGVDQAIPVKVEKVYTDEFGFRTKSSGVKSVYSQASYDDESLMLTGDLNVLDVEWIVQFKINDPFKVLFNIRDADKTIRDISESVVRTITGDYTFNEVLTTKRIEINIKAQEEMQRILDDYQAGIQVVKVKLQDVNPPDPVKPAFNEVNQAKQEKEKLINQAWEVYNQKMPQAKGEALKMVKEAEGYALEKINVAQGDTKRFLLLQQEYKQAKDVTLKRHYLEYMGGVLNNAGK
ncbi:MAG: FtsH protease activity modulator HflK, partial [Candidatus Omnitrophica bacterium]|nr:FtsH protease activity modulator HflK [Candidatus Omnitrophota bacterium]